MFTPLIAKPQAKTAARPAADLARRRAAAFAPHRGDWGVERPEREPRIPVPTPPSLAWDFAKIPLYPLGRSRGSQPRPPFRASLPETIQRKLAIGQTDDALEHEADRVADQVMRTPASEVVPASAPLRISRKCEACEEERDLQQKSAGTAEAIGGEAIGRVDEVLRSPGQPLDAFSRAYFEPRFDRDFSRVRVHTDARAAASARDVNAAAYTVGRHIVFGVGRFAPAAHEGRRLIAHELAHVVQQSQGTLPREQVSFPVKGTACGRGCDQGSESLVPAAAGAPSIASVGPRARPDMAALQRQADISQAPSDLPCVEVAGAGHLPGTDVLFDLNSAVVKSDGVSAIAAFVASWVKSGSTDEVFVDGWASTEGTQLLNWRLSCDRAEAVKAALVSGGVPATKITTFAHGETTEFSATDPTKDRRAIITRPPARAPVPPPTPVPAPEPAPAPAAVPSITSETVAALPTPRTRTTIGVGEEVNLTYSAGTTRWTTSGPAGRIRGLLSNDAGDTVKLTAPDTAQFIVVTAGSATLTFLVVPPTDVHMDRFPGTGIKHTLNRANSGIATLPFLLPDIVNFYNVVYHEMDVVGVPTTPGVYSCNPFSKGHCGHGGSGPCGDLTLTNTVVSGKGTQASRGDCAYSGSCGPPPYTPGSVTLTIPYEYKVGGGPFHQFCLVTQIHTLAPDASTLTSYKAGASGFTTVAAATSKIPQCP